MLLLILALDFVFNFVGLWLLLSLFDKSIDPDKIKRITVLALIIAVLGIIGLSVGLLGVFAITVVVIFMISKVLDCDIRAAFLFSVGLAFLKNYVLFNLLQLTL